MKYDSKTQSVQLYLLAIFVGTLAAANVIAGIKLTNLFGFVLPAAFLAYSITFPITDIVADVYGKKVAQKFVYAGFLANVFLVSMFAIAYYMPALTPEMQSTYEATVMPALRIVTASLIAYLLSQTHDVHAFHFWKEKTGGKHLWFRNNASTIVSQAIDTTVFITLAFYGVVPNTILLTMIWSQWIWKVVIALLDTPFVYLGVKILSKNSDH